MKLFFCYAGKIWPYFVCAVICLIIESYVELVQPAMLSDIVDVGVANGDMGYVLRTAGVMLSFVILSAFGAAGRNNFASYGSQLFGKNVRSDLYRKISNLSPEALDYFGAGTLMTRMTNDVSQMQMTMQGLMRIFVRAPILCVGSIIMAYTINPSLAMMPICIVPIIFVLIIVNIKIGFPLYDKVQKALDDVNSMIREYLSGVRVVKAFNRFKYETDRFNVPNDRLKKTSTQAMRVMAFFNPTVTFIIYMGITFILWIGGNRVNAGTMKAGQIIAFVSYMTQLLHSLNMISNIFQNLVRCKASSERVSEIMYCEDVEFVSEKPEKLDLTKGIEFRNVDFSYRNSTGRAALSDVSFKCGIGERVGIIGATGSGKTTILSLILQFYKPTSGSISIFGVDSLKSDPAEVRKNLAVVSQRVMLFTGTI
ncbi:MAG: ABC transporter ATP-binding protein, partial [Clostridiales bacterium]|nr:ABC transporter ATP-binding protein [Clostridiales bacterium]